MNKTQYMFIFTTNKTQKTQSFQAQIRSISLFTVSKLPFLGQARKGKGKLEEEGEIGVSSFPKIRMKSQMKPRKKINR